ncbi:MAG: tetratricopeptide repeat protein [Alistipes sp.]|nr:tetratricopeptide repeat protein [Alistipes sp.]
MKKVVAILLVAVFCCGFVPQHTSPHPDGQLTTEQYTEAIKSLTIHQDTLRAKDLLRLIMERDSTHAPSLAMLARLEQNLALRAKYAQRAYEGDTTNLHYADLYLDALIRTSQYKAAIPLAYRLIERSTEPGNYHVLAALLAEMGRKGEAIVLLDSAYSRLGRFSPLRNLQQRLLLEDNRIEEAETIAKRDIQKTPYDAECYLALANLYNLTRRDSLAVATYQQGLEVDGENLDLLVAFGGFYYNRQQMGEYLAIVDRLFAHKQVAVEKKCEVWAGLRENQDNYRQYLAQYDALIKRLFALHPDNEEVLDQYIVHLFMVGKKEEAMILSKKHLASTPQPKMRDFARVISGEVGLERPDSAFKYIKQAYRHFPKEVELIRALSYHSVGENRFDEAIEYCHQALMYVKDDIARSEIWGDIGDIEAHRNEKKRCYKAYDKALQYNPDNHSVLNNYAYFLSEEGRNLEQALAMASRAISLSKSNATYLDTMAWVLYKLGRYDEAKRYMQQALSLDREKSVEMALHYGDILFALGDKFMAELYWRKALERGADVKEIEARFKMSKQQ